MVNSWELDKVYRCLADETRRDILLRLAIAKSTLTVGELSRSYVPGKMSKPAISKHLRVLEEAGLINRKMMGRICDVSLNPKPLFKAEEGIEGIRKFWERKL